MSGVIVVAFETVLEILGYPMMSTITCAVCSPVVLAPGRAEVWTITFDRDAPTGVYNRGARALDRATLQGNIDPKRREEER